MQDELPDNEAPVRITLYQGLPKADKLDFIVQKSVKRIIPLNVTKVFHQNRKQPPQNSSNGSCRFVYRKITSCNRTSGKRR